MTVSAKHVAFFYLNKNFLNGIFSLNHGGDICNLIRRNAMMKIKTTRILLSTNLAALLGLVIINKVASHSKKPFHVCPRLYWVCSLIFFLVEQISLWMKKASRHVCIFSLLNHATLAKLLDIIHRQKLCLAYWTNLQCEMLHDFHFPFFPCLIGGGPEGKFGFNWVMSLI